MTAVPNGGVGWIPLHEHLEAIREADIRLAQERDRRYAEVDAEREKALRIKDEADRKALELAREIQTYKDEKANELREQINSERGLYATKADVVAAVEKLRGESKPVAEYVASQQGRTVGIGDSRALLFTFVTVAIAAVGLLLAFAR